MYIHFANITNSPDLQKLTCLQPRNGPRGKGLQSIKIGIVSLTRSGYPQIIPPFHRFEIHKKIEHSDLLVNVICFFFFQKEFSYGKTKL